MDLKRILCPVDFLSAVQFGIRTAVSLASRYGAEIILVHVLDYPPPSPTARPVLDVIRSLDLERFTAEARLEDLATSELGHSVSSRCLVQIGTPHHEIARIAKETEADLIILPTQSKSTLKRWFLGGTADKVIRSAPCPVLLVPPQGTAACEFHPRKIMFATDLSGFSDQALPWTLSLAERYGSELLMVLEVDPANPAWRFPHFPIEYIEAVEDAAVAQLDARAQKAVAVQTRVLRGSCSALKIVECANKEAAELLVLATHEHTGLIHVLLGSTAERVVHYSRCPILFIRHPAQLASRLDRDGEGREERPSYDDRQTEESPLWNVPSSHIAHHP